MTRHTLDSAPPGSAKARLRSVLVLLGFLAMVIAPFVLWSLAGNAILAWIGEAP